MLPSQPAPPEGHDDQGNRFRFAFEQAPLPIWFSDTQMRFTHVNYALCQMLGLSQQELLGRALGDFAPADERSRIQRVAAAMLRGDRDEQTFEQQLECPDGSPMWAQLALRLIRDADEKPRYFVGQATDVTEHRLRERRLRHLADHDPLTGLVNRRGFGRELRRHVSRLARYGSKGALLMLDLDNFKRYNDTNGHAGGDALLKAVAEALCGRLRAGDVVGRIGGDEFAVLLPEATPEQANVVASALVQAIRELGQARAPHVTGSIGVFCFDDESGLSEHHAMVGADLAMYAAKHAGRDRHAPLAPWTSTSASRTM